MKTRFERPRYQALLERYRDTEFIKVLKGIRRCGKSTLLDLFADGLRAQGVPERNLFRKRFDEFGLPLNLNAEDLQEEIAKALAMADGAQTFYVFLDEVQMVPGWERVVRGLHTRPGVDVYITGSNAYLLSSDLATLLSGRYVELDVYPLSFREYRSFCAQAGRAALGKEELLSEYLRYGGMPSLFALKDPLEEDIARELSGIYNTVILNDVAQRFQIRDYALLEKLVTYVFSTSGNLFSVKSIVNYLRSSGVKASYETIDGYLYALEQALILYGVMQDGLQGKELLRPQRKFYPVDTGLRNLAIGFAMRDVGFQLENGWRRWHGGGRFRRTAQGRAPVRAGFRCPDGRDDVGARALCVARGARCLPEVPDNHRSTSRRHDGGRYPHRQRRRLVVGGVGNPTPRLLL